MKRKIGIIIAAIVAISGIALSGVLSGKAYAATYCSYDGKDAGNKTKRCAHILMVDHFSLMGDCVPSSNATSSACKAKIKSYTKFSYGSIPSSAQTSYTNGFVDSVATIIKGGDAKYDPCKYAGNDCMKSQWPYYSDTDPNGSGGGGNGNGNNNGGDGSDGKSKKGKETAANTGDCTSILPASWCNKGSDNQNSANGIGYVIKLIIGIMTGAIVVAGTIGIVICGILWMTARDNESQVVTAKRRLLEIVIGLVAWGLVSVLINFFIPQGEAKTDSVIGDETITNVEKKA